MTYSQTTGELRAADGTLLGTGYSGAGEGKNNPAMQAIHDVGPIPQGEWIIGPPYCDEERGDPTMRLSPQGHNAFDRTGFLIHGDNATHTASLGCMIFLQAIRLEIVARRAEGLFVNP